MDIMLTVSALLIQALLLVAGYVQANRADAEARRVKRLREHIEQQDARLDSIVGQLQKLRGKVYADDYHARKQPDIFEGELVDESTLSTEEKNRLIRDRLRAQHGLRGNIAKPNGAEE